MSHDYLVSSNENNMIYEKVGCTFEEVASLPIRYLNLSQDAQSYIYSKFDFIDGKKVSKFRTMGDLVSYGYKNVLDDLEDSNLLHKVANEILLNIESELAQFALKLKGSDFSIYDISLKSLLIDNQTRQFLKNNFKSKETVGDLVHTGRSFIKQVADSTSNMNAYYSLKDLLKQFNVHFDNDNDGTIRKKKKISPEDEVLNKIKLSTTLFPRVIHSVELHKMETQVSAENAASVEKPVKNDKASTLTNVQSHTKTAIINENPAKPAEISSKAAPSPAKTAEIVSENAPDVAKTAEISSKAAPRVEKSAKIVNENAPNLEKTAEIVSKAAPSPAKSAKIVNETVPSLEKTATFGEDAAKTAVSVKKTAKTAKISGKPAQKIAKAARTPKKEYEKDSSEKVFSLKNAYVATQGEINYTKAVAKINQGPDFKNKSEFLEYYQIVPNTLTKMLYGKPLKVCVLKHLCDVFEAKPQELFEFNNSELEAKFKIYMYGSGEQEKLGPDHSGNIDEILNNGGKNYIYSSILEIMKKHYDSIYDFAAACNVRLPVVEKIIDGSIIPVGEFKHICARLRKLEGEKGVHARPNNENLENAIKKKAFRRGEEPDEKLCEVLRNYDGICVPQLYTSNTSKYDYTNGLRLIIMKFGNMIEARKTLHITPSAIAAMQKGDKVSFYTLFKIIKTLGCKIDEFVKFASPAEREEFEQIYKCSDKMPINNDKGQKLSVITSFINPNYNSAIMRVKPFDVGKVLDEPATATSFEQPVGIGQSAAMGAGQVGDAKQKTSYLASQKRVKKFNANKAASQCEIEQSDFCEYSLGQ